MNYEPERVIETEEIRGKLLNFIIDNFHVEMADIKLDESLMDTGIIDSLGLIEILAFFEEEFSVVTGEEQMTKENLGSVNRMVDYVQRERERMFAGTT